MGIPFITKLLRMTIISLIISLISCLILILISIAFFTLVERKFLGYSHLRKGPNKVSFIGILQPISDAIKLFLKQPLSPFSTSKVPFWIVPCIGLFLALALWVLYAFQYNPTNFSLAVILFLSISSVRVYSSLLAGWIRNSKFSLVGALRRRAQTISYEVSIAFVLLCPLIIHGSYNLQDCGTYSILVFILPFLFLVWIVTLLAETNRTPFDLAEGESELVSGFNTEYISGPFAIIFIAEYLIILWISVLTAYLFFSITPFPFHFIDTISTTVFAVICSLFFIWTRTTLPRFRYDQLIYICWKTFLPSLIPINLFCLYSSYYLLFVSFKKPKTFNFMMGKLTNSVVPEKRVILM